MKKKIFISWSSVDHRVKRIAEGYKNWLTVIFENNGNAVKRYETFSRRFLKLFAPYTKFYSLTVQRIGGTVLCTAKDFLKIGKFCMVQKRSFR